MRIRHYTLSDKKKLIQLIQLNTPTYFDPSETKEYDDYLDQEIEDYFVVEEDSMMIAAGGINYMYDQKIARISWDMVHPEHQGKGIGSLLLQHRLTHLQGNPNIEIIEVRTSQLTHKFYGKSGFKLVEIKENFWAPGFDLYAMRKLNE